MDTHPRHSAFHKKTVVVCTVVIIILTFIGCEFFTFKVSCGFVIMCIFAAVYLGAVLLLIPLNQKIELTEKSISFNSNRKCRSFNWEEINNVRCEEKVLGCESGKKVILEIISNYYTKKEKDELQIYLFSVEAEIYGYTPENLIEIIRKNISNKAFELTNSTVHNPYR